MKRILIADRGEVALRVIRTVKELGIEAIAVYSEADSDMRYLRYADEKVQIGPTHPSKSYLNMEAIMSVALTWKANAIHPGYGFLAENPMFASWCEENGIVFIGPSSVILRIIANKARAKDLALSIGIPAIPGSFGEVDNIEDALAMARDIGMPVMLKSLYGGGGRGMRVARDEDQLRKLFTRVQSEALAAFGKSGVYIEHYINSPRHLEVQVMADEFGTIQILGDRECSIQRRHQKIIEEAPIPNIEEDTRKRLWLWARQIMEAIEFRGLGTVEFLMDQDGNIYFMEINGRLQVEHPVTEMITGMDMVRQQILIAAGAHIDGGEPTIKGHAIECRINAEDPSRNFMPTTGIIRHVYLPGGPGVRVDTHIFPGCEITSYYDPLLVKLIAYNTTRKGAIKRMLRMLDETFIQGVTTNKDFLHQLLLNPKFYNGNGDTSLVNTILKQ